MHQTSIYVLTIFYTVLCGCSHQLPPQTESENWQGRYESAVFIQPGPTDGAYDVQASGGHLHVTLLATNRFQANLFVPGNPKEFIPERRENADGMFSVNGDTLAFSQGFWPLSNEQWLHIADTLKTIDRIRRGPLSVILVKTQ